MFTKEEVGIFERKFLGEQWTVLYKEYKTTVRELSDSEIRKRYAQWQNETDPNVKLTPVDELHNLSDEELFKYHNCSEDVWDIRKKRFTHSASGNTFVQVMFVKKTLKTSPIELKFDDIPKYTKKWKESKTKESDLYVLTLFDIHLGKKADEFTTGEKVTLDGEISKLESIFEQTLNIIPNGKEIILPIGQDLFNADNHQGTTTKGTPQSNDAHMLEVFQRALPIFISFITELTDRKIKVNLLYSMGNHDVMIAGSFYLALAEYFKNHSYVESISNNISPRQYYQKNKYTCMFVHGNNKDFKNIHEVFTIEKPEYWTNSKLRDVYSGHTHGLQIKENFGLTIYVGQSPSGNDKWHNTEGYIGNVKACQLHEIDTTIGVKKAIHNIHV